jgi:lipid II:glycine glycyltransferase (peptidoglycan interpeptide bridge formation enzyme)
MARLMAATVAKGAAADWDQQLTSWPRANLLQSYGWGEVQSRAGWETVRLLVPIGLGQLPLTALVGPSGLPGTSRIYVPRGPVCAPDDLEGFAAVEASLLELGRARRAMALELEVPWTVDEVGPEHPFLGWTAARPRQPLATSLVDLTPEPDSILNSFHAKTRYNVRLAERRGVTVRPGRIEELVSCVRATETRQRIHLPSEPHLKNVMEQLGAAAQVLVAEAEGEVAAAVLLARWGTGVVYLYGGATDVHRQLMPNHLLHWRAMMLAREEGCTEYDLWGIPESDRPDHPWHGLAQFKLGFGGCQLRYAGCRRRDLRPAGGRMVALADAARQWARGRWRR